MSKASREKTKVVVRKLPPALTEESFLSAVSLLLEGRHDWFSYHQGKISANRIVYSRAYINFQAVNWLYEFKEKFDGHVFVSNKGTRYQCSVEYAPFQKVPKPPVKKDAREGTIERDPDYQQFIQRLEEGPQQLPSASAQLERRETERKAAAAAGDSASSVVITPLMEHIRNLRLKSSTRRGTTGRGRGRDGGRAEDLAAQQLQARGIQSGVDIATSTARAAAKAASDKVGSKAPAAISAASSHQKQSGKEQQVRGPGTRQAPADVMASKAAEAAMVSKVAQRPEVKVKQAQAVVDAALSKILPKTPPSSTTALVQDASSRAQPATPQAPAITTSSQEARHGTADAPETGTDSAPAADSTGKTRKIRAGFQTYVPRVRHGDAEGQAGTMQAAAAVAQAGPAAAPSSRLQQDKGVGDVGRPATEPSSGGGASSSRAAASESTRTSAGTAAASAGAPGGGARKVVGQARPADGGAMPSPSTSAATQTSQGGKPGAGGRDGKGGRQDSTAGVAPAPAVPVAGVAPSSLETTAAAAARAAVAAAAAGLESAGDAQDSASAQDSGGPTTAAGGSGQAGSHGRRAGRGRGK